MTLEELSIAISALNDPEAPKQEGMVSMVWHDGEVTCTKSGSLLGQRNLHMLEFPFKDLRMELPNKTVGGTNTFIWISYDGAKLARKIIEDYISEREVMRHAD